VTPDLDSLAVTLHVKTGDLTWPDGPSTATAPATRGLRLHVVCTLHGLPIAFALTRAKADERETLPGMLDAEPALVTTRPGQALTGDKNYFGAAFERRLAQMHARLLRPARKA
jgi:hypothetical protein